MLRPRPLKHRCDVPEGCGTSGQGPLWARARPVYGAGSACSASHPCSCGCPSMCGCPCRRCRTCPLSSGGGCRSAAGVRPPTMCHDAPCVCLACLFMCTHNLCICAVCLRTCPVRLHAWLISVCPPIPKTSIHEWRIPSSKGEHGTPGSPPPPPVSKNHLAQEPPPGSAVEFSTSLFFARVMGFSWFWWKWDSCSGVQDNISCVLLRVPPSGGTLSVSHSCTYPLNPSPLLSTPSPKQPAPDKETNKSQLNTVEH